MWHVYILQSEKDGGYYVGCSNDHKRRLKEHNNGHNESIKNRKPWKVVREEVFENQQSAYAREKQIKSYKGGNAFKKLLNL